MQALGDIKQAKEDVSEDGYWCVKQTSKRLFDFASALAGDDTEKKGLYVAKINLHDLLEFLN